MKFSSATIAFAAVLLCVASFAEAKPTLITKKLLLKKFVVPRVLSGEWKLPSLYIPYPLSLWWPSTSDAASSPAVVYHSLPEEDTEVLAATPEAVQTMKDFVPIEQQQQFQQLPSANVGPVYIAETPAVKHVAPLPQGYTEDVHSVNVQPAPGTVA